MCAPPPASNAISQRAVIATAAKRQQHTKDHFTSKKTNNTKGSSPYLLSSNQNSSSGSLSSVFKTLVVPQRSSSIRSSKSYTTKKQSPASSLDIDQTSHNSSTGSSWNFLRTIKKNQSSTNLKKTIPNDEILRQAGLDPNKATTTQNATRSNNGKSNQHQQQHQKSVLHVSENGQDVMILEMHGGKLQVVAGTAEKLFLKLADETAQDLDYVDTFIMNHTAFTASIELLENLIARFHLEALPGEADYFKKWQRCIQVKVLNVISRWVKLQYQDFKKTPVLQTRLETFINGDIKRAGFTTEASMIKDALDLQMAQHARQRHSLVALTSHSLASFKNNNNGTFSSTSSSNSNGSILSPLSPTSPPTPSSLGSPQFQRRPSVPSTTPHLFSLISTPPSSPTLTHTPISSLSSPLFSLEARDVARYLTLADFYTLKCITSYDYLCGGWRRNNNGSTTRDDGYIGMMIKRANLLTHWIPHELCAIKPLKQRRNGLRKLIEIAKLCLEYNNFHTSMVIIMGLTSAPVQKLEEVWESLPSRDMNTFTTLKRHLDVSNNMANYRQAFAKKAKAPAVPFFPLVLKDLTFYMDGNRTTCYQQQQQEKEGLINFSKFRSLTQFVHHIGSYTNENYWFTGDLEHLAFFSQKKYYQNNNRTAGPLDHVAELFEYGLRTVADCCNDPHCESQLLAQLS
ncbi:ras guanine nucleotide exchange factor domain-containing protein [Circinella umbellata]|nr:ras guanine nucleotide exchange factor domain-containing protein [Circinella umbellata]